MKKIGVVGSINMDMTVMAERIPLKGETLKGENLRYIPGGKGANQAVAMAKLGAEVEMFGCVGDDDAGQKLVALKPGASELSPKSPQGWPSSPPVRRTTPLLWWLAQTTVWISPMWNPSGKGF